MKAAYLVCYDIADEKRLARIYRFMKGKGLHLQYSVFYCVLTPQQLKNLKDESLFHSWVLEKRLRRNGIYMSNSK
ncbi:CRISPR-associated endonuclease Cas2 [Thermodesulfovibrio sp. 3462-1]|jgi:CRISPR-associated protein Cas2|uniref:CRISPR-associated endonuclease Cas2 n=1 Tax=Thermodesulfovibrio obliviosus TaxID=3118332 RepID=A0AAU8H3R2_9BACT